MDDNRIFSRATKACDYLFDGENEVPSKNIRAFWDAIPDSTNT